MATSSNASQTTRTSSYTSALIVLTSLFFMWGLITSLNDILIPHLKGVFTLNYVEAMLIQFCFFTAYFVMSYPSGWLVEKLGYKLGIIIGLSVAGIGCLLFYPAAAARVYGIFLFALFVLASGITLLQVAANPYVTELGSPETASRRLNLTQAFNSLGTTIGPYFGSVLILQAVTGQPVDAVAEAQSVQGPYIGLAIALFLLALVFSRIPLPQIAEQETAITNDQKHSSVWQYRHLILGAVGIFTYVGAEVSIGSFFVNFASQPYVAGLSEHDAGRLLSLYWGGAMVGRFVGVVLMTYIRPGTLLAFNACINMLLLVIAMMVGGTTAMYAVLAIGLFNSIMFPTIFSLALKGLGHFTSKGSGILCMAIVGGAIVPVIQGALADQIGLLPSFILPVICYFYIFFYGIKGHKPRD
ncbi:sugar MFS transporter [Microvirga sp. W0021]|uniref:Sugar MFS transporter n=1 Tax=Hohaiivirga grylli TaxID=3133970 RepID=A0ABV0BHQ4_9HYPH